MNDRDRRTSLAKMLFYLAFATRVFIGTIEITVIVYSKAGDIVHHIGWYVSFFLAAASILCQKDFSAKSIFVIAGVSLIVVMSSFGSRTTTLLALMVFIFAAKDISVTRMMKMFIVIHITMAVVCVFGAKLGLIENVLWEQGDRVRYSLGYRYTTYLSKVFFFVSIYYMVIRDRKFSLFELLIIESVNYWIFLQTDSRTTFYILCLLPFVFYFSGKRRRRKKTFRFRIIYKYIYVLCALLCFGVLYGYMFHKNDLFEKLNNVLSGRLAISEYDILEYGIPLFGNNVEWVGQVAKSFDETLRITFIDCSYLNIVMVYGAVPFVLFMAMTVYIMDYSLRLKKFSFIIAHVAAAVHFMIEPQLADLTYSILLLIFSNSVSNKKEVSLCFYGTELFQYKFTEKVMKKAHIA